MIFSFSNHHSLHANHPTFDIPIRGIPMTLRPDRLGGLRLLPEGFEFGHLQLLR